jgi:hypothetical protein
VSAGDQDSRPPAKSGPEGCVVIVAAIALGVLALLGASMLWLAWSERQGGRDPADPRNLALATICDDAVRQLSLRSDEFAAVRSDRGRPIARPTGAPPWTVKCPVRLGAEPGQLSVSMLCAGAPTPCFGQVGPLSLPGRNVLLR